MYIRCAALHPVRRKQQVNRSAGILWAGRPLGQGEDRDHGGSIDAHVGLYTYTHIHRNAYIHQGKDAASTRRGRGERVRRVGSGPHFVDASLCAKITRSASRTTCEYSRGYSAGTHRATHKGTHGYTDEGTPGGTLWGIHGSMRG
jgi:hypothetical protein